MPKNALFLKDIVKIALRWARPHVVASPCTVKASL